MNSFWQQVEPMIINGLAVIIPVAVGTAIAWLRARASTWSTVKGAVRQAEAEGSSSGFPLTGYEKHRLALQIVQEAKPRMPSARASQMIEAVLPEVRRESDTPPPRTPRSG